MKRDLEWGETPWDDMPREELVRETQRLYAALVEARRVLESYGCGDSKNPFWQRGGDGGDALEMAGEALGTYGDVRAVLYRSFFRYAVGLLFPGVGADWHVCVACGLIIGSDERADVIHDGHARAPTRPIEWRDLAPKRAAEGGKA